MWEGEVSPLSMTLHEKADFHSFNTFKNFRVVLYNKKVTFYYETPQNLKLVDSINFDKDETGKYMVSTGIKLITFNHFLVPILIYLNNLLYLFL